MVFFGALGGVCGAFGGVCGAAGRGLGRGSGGGVGSGSGVSGRCCGWAGGGGADPVFGEVPHDKTATTLLSVCIASTLRKIHTETATTLDKCLPHDKTATTLQVRRSEQRK